MQHINGHSLRMTWWRAIGLYALFCCILQTTDGRANPLKVEVVGADGRFMLLRGGEPYRVNGAGIDAGDLESFAAHGGTSVRTWTTTNGQELLDRAQALGITVSMCLPVAHERYGFDYDDPKAVEEQFERLKAEVLRYKDHPALLTWIIGNELNHDFTNPRVYDAVNELSKMIHAVDPTHPTTTTIAGFSAELVEFIQARASNLDFLSFQLYGELFALPGYLARSGFKMPYFVTEWGAIGYWEVDKTRWGAPIEQDSSAKARTYLNGYRKVIQPFSDQALGNYVFLWGQKQERTPTWFGMFTETGEETEAVDVMHFIWNGVWPANRSPRLKSLRLNGDKAHQNVTLAAGQRYQAKVAAVDPDGDALTYRWQIKPESTARQVAGDREAAIGSVPGLIEQPSGASISVRAPQKPGAYRLFVYVYDGNDHAAHANIPFYVEP